MRTMRGLAIILLLAAGPALAGAFAARDLGPVGREPVCMEAARRALDDAILRFGGGEIAQSGWAVAGTGLWRGRYDALITCTFGPGMKLRGTLVVHSADSDPRRLTLADALEHGFLDHAARLDP